MTHAGLFPRANLAMTALWEVEPGPRVTDRQIPNQPATWKDFSSLSVPQATLLLGSRYWDTSVTWSIGGLLLSIHPVNIFITRYVLNSGGGPSNKKMCSRPHENTIAVWESQTNNYPS